MNPRNKNRRLSYRVSPNDYADAIQVVSMLEECKDEFSGMLHFLSLIRIAVRRQDNHHRFLLKRLDETIGSMRKDWKDFYELWRSYQKWLMDYEHRYGKPDAKHQRHYADVCTTLFDVLGENPEDEEVYDFLDGIE